MDELGPTNRRPIGPTLWRERYTIAASILVMVALALAYTLTSAKAYEASAIVQVNLVTATPGSTDTTNANAALAQSYGTLLTSPGFLSQVKSHVDGGKLGVDSLQSRLSVTVPTQSALINLHATGPSPKAAQTLAQEVIMGFLVNLQSSAMTRTAQLAGQLQRQIAGIAAQIASLRVAPQAAATADQIRSLQISRQALIGQNATLIANGLAQGTSAIESSAPVASSSPISPKRSLNLIAGLLLGVLLGVGMAWLRGALRPAIHSSEEITALVDLPLLASIPLRSKLRADDMMLAEAYRVLRANLTFAVRDSDTKVVTFVGFNPQVGKTSIVEGLARASGASERQIVLVDGDMRLPSLSRRLGHRDGPGLSDVLGGAASLDDALVEVGNGISLLPTRPSRVNAASLLAGHRIEVLMQELRERFDLVLIDTPPLSGLADGLILASQSDAVVLVLRAGVTKPGDLTAATNGVLHNMTPIAGLVVFEELPEERDYYGAPQAEAEPSPAVVGR